MSNNKSLKERLNNIRDEGPNRWLSRQLSFGSKLFEGPAERLGGEDAVAMGGTMAPTESPKDPIVPPQRPQMSVSSGAESGGSSPASASQGGRFIRRLQGLGERVNADIADGTFRPNNRRSSRVPAALSKVLDRLKDERFHPTISDFHDQYKRRQNPEFAENWNSKTNFETAEDVIAFLESEDGMGMTRNERGMLQYRPRSPGEHMAAGRAPGAGGGMQPFKGITQEERRIYQDQDAISHVQGVAGGTSDNEVNAKTLIDFHKAAQKNGLSISEIRKVIAQLDKSVTSGLHKIGAPDGANAFNPPDDWDAVPQGEEGNWEGFTDYDALQWDDEDGGAEFAAGFGAPGVSRLESYIQRLVNSGFRTEDTMQPVETFDGATEDHILGKELAPTGYLADAPINRGIVSSGVNMTKAGEHVDGKDSFNKVINMLQDEDGDETMLKTLLEMYPEELEEGEEEMDNGFLSHAAKRLTGAHFDPKRLGRVIMGDEKAGMADNVESIMAMTDMADQLGHLNLRQVARNLPVPRSGRNAQQYNPNTNNGIAMAANPGTHKNNFAKILLMHAAKNPEFLEALRLKEEELRAPRYGGRNGNQRLADNSESKVSSGLDAFKKDQIKQIVGPLKGISTLFTLGGLGDGTHSALPKEFTKKGLELLEQLKDNEEVAPHYETLKQGLMDDETSWTEGLSNRYGDEGPYQWDGTEGEEYEKVVKSFKERVDWTKTLMKSAKARAGTRQDLQDAFFESLTPEELSNDSSRDPIYENDFKNGLVL